MEDINTKIAKMEADHSAKVAAMKTEHAIAMLAPVPPKRAMLVSTGEKAWLTYEAKSLWDAIDIMAMFEPLAFNEYKGTFTRFGPEAINERPDNRHKGDYVSGPYICQIKVRHGEGFGPNVTLTFFAYCGADIVRVNCDLETLGRGGFWQYAANFVANDRGQKERLDGRRYIRGDYRANNALNGLTDKTTTWGTGCDRSAEHSYAIMADDDSDSWEHARGQLENIAQAMHGDRV